MPEAMWLAMARTAPRRSPAQQRLDDGQMLAGLGGQAMIVVARFRVVPGRVAEGPEQDLQAAELVDQERVPAPAGDQVVQPAVERLGLPR